MESDSHPARELLRYFFPGTEKMGMDSKPSIRHFAITSFAILIVWTSGCSSALRSDMSPFKAFRGGDESEKVATEMRQRFLVERDSKALAWLLQNRVHNEQTVHEVGQILGEPGERLSNDGEYKRHSGFYYETDVGYQWGPDQNGRSIVLFFRDGKLVHFDPKEFRSPES